MAPHPVAVLSSSPEVGGLTAALLRISAGVPEAMSSPKSSTKIRLDSESTVATSCSTIRTTHWCSRSPRAAENRSQVLGLAFVQSRQRFVQQHDIGAGGEGSGHLDQTARAQRKYADRGLGHAGQVEQLKMLVHSFVLLASRPGGANGVDHVPPQPLAGVADPVGQDDVLAHGQPHEQLRLLKGPCQALRARSCGLALVTSLP